MWAIIAAFVPGGRRPQASAASGSTHEADEKENADAAPDGAGRPDHAESGAVDRSGGEGRPGSADQPLVSARSRRILL
jgi:hypothetical protein